MKKQAAPEPSSVRLHLKTTKVDFINLKEKANQNNRSKGRSTQYAIVAVDKALLADVLADYETLLKSLKNLGGFFSRELHYSETKEWKRSIGKPVKAADVPAFFKPPNRRRIRL